MADEPIARRDFYVYALYRANGVTPFYIGKGRGNRWHIHERDAHFGHSRKDRIIQSMHQSGIRDIPKRKLAEGLTDDEAKALEIHLIATIGRLPNGPLANHTKGGDGAQDMSPEAVAQKSASNVASWKNPSTRQKRIDGIKATWTPEKRLSASLAKKAAATEEFRAKLRAVQARPEIKARKLASMLSSWNDPNYRAKRAMTIGNSWASLSRREAASLKAKEVNARPEVKEKKRIAMTGKIQSYSTKKKRSDSMKVLWSNDEFREHASKRLKESKAVPERRERQRQIMNDPELRKKLDAGNARPEVRKRRIAAQKAAFSTEEAYLKRSEASKAMWARKKALKNGSIRE